MALNCAMLSPARAPIPLPHELTIKTVDSGVELTLIIPNAPSAGISSGGSGGSTKLKELGRLWLTDQRLIFVSAAPSPSLESLSAPLISLLSTKFEQPLFGANCLIVDINPTKDGGLTQGTKAEVRMKEKGLFEFSATLDKTRERAIYMKRNAADEEDTLPAYTTPSGAGPSSSGNSANIPDDNPPGYEA